MDNWWRIVAFTLAVFALGLAIGRTTSPRCTEYHEPHEHGTACIVDSPEGGSALTYYPEEP